MGSLCSPTGERPLLLATRGSAHAATETQHSQKVINKQLQLMSKEEEIKTAFTAPGSKSEPPPKVWLSFFHFFSFVCSSAHSFIVHLLIHYTFIHSFRSCLWGLAESDTTEVTSQQQQQPFLELTVMGLMCKGCKVRCHVYEFIHNFYELQIMHKVQEEKIE